MFLAQLACDSVFVSVSSDLETGTTFKCDRLCLNVDCRSDLILSLQFVTHTVFYRMAHFKATFTFIQRVNLQHSDSATDSNQHEYHNSASAPEYI